MKALIYHRISNNNGGVAGGSFGITNSNIFNVYSRYLHEPALYKNGTQFYFETTGINVEGAGCNVILHRVYDADVGVPVQTAICEDDAVVDEGKKWENLAGIGSGTDLDMTTLTITTNGTLAGVADETVVANDDDCIIDVSGFTFSLPADSAISYVAAVVRHAQVHITFTSSSFTTCTTPFPATSVSGAQLTVNLNANLSTKSTPINNLVLGACNSFTIVLTDRDFNFSGVITDPDELNNETFTLKIQASYPTFQTADWILIRHYFDSVAMVAGYGVDIDSRPVTSGTTTRSRSSALSTLNADTRYIVRFDSDSDNNILHSNSFIIAEVP